MGDAKLVYSKVFYERYSYREGEHPHDSTAPAEDELGYLTTMLESGHTSQARINTSHTESTSR